MSGPLSDQRLGEIEEFLDVWDAAPAHRTRYRDVISSQKSGEDGRKLRTSTLRAVLAEVRRLRGERGDLTEKLDAATKTAVRLAEQRDHLTSAFDKLGDQMGELVQAARSERERYTAENQRLRAELADVAGYLAAIHRHAGRYDLLGKDLGCAGCALLARIESGAEP